MYFHLQGNLRNTYFFHSQRSFLKQKRLECTSYTFALTYLFFCQKDLCCTSPPIIITLTYTYTSLSLSLSLISGNLYIVSVFLFLGRKKASKSKTKILPFQCLLLFTLSQKGPSIYLFSFATAHSIYLFFLSPHTHTHYTPTHLCIHSFCTNPLLICIPIRNFYLEFGKDSVKFNSC
jgi:hypothetical protein